ncbi:hypothetical protein D3C86_1568350 [compost metagenome]
MSDPSQCIANRNIFRLREISFLKINHRSVVRINDSVRYVLITPDNDFFQSGIGVFPLVIVPVVFMGVVLKFNLVKVKYIGSYIGHAPGNVFVKTYYDTRCARQRYTIGI